MKEASILFTKFQTFEILHPNLIHKESAFQNLILKALLRWPRGQNQTVSMDTPVFPNNLPDHVADFSLNALFPGERRHLDF